MTTERLREIRERVLRYGETTSAHIAELLVEVDDLRAASSMLIKTVDVLRAKSKAGGWVSVEGKPVSEWPEWARSGCRIMVWCNDESVATCGELRHYPHAWVFVDLGAHWLQNCVITHVMQLPGTPS